MSKRKYIWKDSILFEDEHYVAVNKPPFLFSVSDRHHEESLLEIARKYYEDIQIGHRLDRDTSGVLVFAKDPESYRHLSLQFEHRKVKKTYHALCDGVHDFKKLKIDLPLYNSGKGLIRVDRNRGKESTTYVNTLNAYSLHTLIECHPITGRTHQIRVHLSSIGAPITGDESYGGKPFYLSTIKKRYNLKKNTEEEPLIKRMALHARSIQFKNPENRTVKIKAEYPRDLQILFKQLERNS